jgi:hypothetical protein
LNSQIDKISSGTPSGRRTSVMHSTSATTKRTLASRETSKAATPRSTLGITTHRTGCQLAGASVDGAESLTAIRMRVQLVAVVPQAGSSQTCAHSADSSSSWAAGHPVGVRGHAWWHGLNGGRGGNSRLRCWPVVVGASASRAAVEVLDPADAGRATVMTEFALGIQPDGAVAGQPARRQRAGGSSPVRDLDRAGLIMSPSGY